MFCMFYILIAYGCMCYIMYNIQYVQHAKHILSVCKTYKRFTISMSRRFPSVNIEFFLDFSSSYGTRGRVGFSKKCYKTGGFLGNCRGPLDGITATPWDGLGADVLQKKKDFPLKTKCHSKKQKLMGHCTGFRRAHRRETTPMMLSSPMDTAHTRQAGAANLSVSLRARQQWGNGVQRRAHSFQNPKEGLLNSSQRENR